jgi:hypothetical protein
MSDLLVVLGTVERELVAALERRPDTEVVAMLRFAAIRTDGRIILALAGSPSAETLDRLSAVQRRTFAGALRRAADAVEADETVGALRDAIAAVSAGRLGQIGASTVHTPQIDVERVKRWRAIANRTA